MPEPTIPPIHSVPVIGPVLPQERIEIIDILRGWAVFGIFLADVDVTFQLATATDRAVESLHSIFVVDKFWPLFSFLFGLGFALQMLRAETRGADFRSVYWRRLLVLLFLGLANKMLLLHFWRGDILHIYAVLGFFLLLSRRASLRILVAAAVVFLLAPQAYDAVVTARHELRLANPQTAQQVVREDGRREAERRRWNQETSRVRSQGTYWQFTERTAKDFARRHSSPDIYLWWLAIFSQFLLGLYVGRRRIFENITAHLPFIRKVVWWELGLGLIGNSVHYLVSEKMPNPALPILTRLLAGLLDAVGDPALSFSYASAFILLLALRPAWRIRLAPLAAVGRMALSNYLFQSLVFVVVCPRYGLGLYGKLWPPMSLALALLIFAVQVPLSVWWMRRFRFGPVEWLWRTLTYGKLQPMRLQRPVGVNA